MTKPLLHDIADGNALHFKGKTLNDAGAGNLLPINIAMVSSADGLGHGGTDIVNHGFKDTPEPLGSGGIADAAIELGAMHLEWTGLSTSEQFTTDSRYVQVSQNQSLGAGAWVYSPTGIEVGIGWIAVTSTGTTAQASAYVYTVVAPDTWTYISQQQTVTNATAVFAAVYIECQGRQRIGDELYVGALYLGSDSSEWTFPTSQQTSVLDLSFRARVLEDGPILAARPAGGITEIPYSISAVGGGFSVAATTHTTSNVRTTRTYSTPTGLFSYGKWHDFRWVYTKATGVQEFYVNGALVDRNTITATTERLSTSYGIQTPVGTDGSHMLLSELSIGGSVGFAASLSGTALEFLGPFTGSEVNLQHNPAETGINQSLHLSESGWVFNVDAVDKGAMKIDYDADLKFGTGDYTYIQSLRAVANDGSRSVFDDGSTVVRATASAGANFNIVSGATVITTASIFDGARANYLVERESGVQLRFCHNDFATYTATTADGGDNLAGVSDLRLGYNSVDARTPMSLGVTLTFKRLLEEFERVEIQGWLESGYPVASEPDWLRTAATLYLNPNDPVQQAEWASNSRLINLAVELPEELRVQYTFTSADGISNPRLNNNTLVVGEVATYDTNTGVPAYDTDPVPVKSLGHGEEPLVTWAFSKGSGTIEVPSESLKPGWINRPWTMSFWFQFLGTEGDNVSRYLVAQGRFSEANGWSILHNSNLNPGRVSFCANVLTIQSHNFSSSDRLRHIAYVNNGGGNVDFYLDGTFIESFVIPTNLDTSRPIEIGGVVADANADFEGVISNLDIWHRALTAGEVGSIQRIGVESQQRTLTDSTTITDSFSHKQYNWEKI